jgi:hypothetical protein
MTLFFVGVLCSKYASRVRTWGFFHTFEDAERHVKNNISDLFEMGYYDLAVIEEMPEGIVPTTKARKWYKAVYDSQTDDPTVEAIECPDKYKYVCNITIG